MTKQPTIDEIVTATKPLTDRVESEMRGRDGKRLLIDELTRLESKAYADVVRVLYADDEPKVERRTPAQIAREPGFYWVKDDDTRWTVGQWRVSKWDGRSWFDIGHDDSDGEDPPHIGPRLQEPSE